MSFDSFGVDPVLRYVLLIASADCAGLALAYSVHDAQRTLLVDVESDDPEKFSSNQPLKCFMGTLIEEVLEMVVVGSE